MPGRGDRMLYALFLATMLADPAAATSDARATALRAQAREALGGESALAGLRSLSLQGHFRRVPPPDANAGASARPSRGPWGRESAGDLELDLALPDKMRREESAAAAGGPGFVMITGLSGDESWIRTEGGSFGGRGFGGRGGPGAPGPGGPPAGGSGRGDEPAGGVDRAAAAAERRAAMGRRMHAELSRLLLALTADPGPGAAFAYVGQAEAPDGHADVLDVKGAAGSSARLFLDATTHVPLMLTYQETMPDRRFRRGPRGGEGAAASPAPEASALPPLADARPPDAPPRTVDVTLFLSDHRAIGGVELPYRISRAVGGNVVEEWEVTKWTVNPRLKPERFENK